MILFLRFATTFISALADFTLIPNVAALLVCCNTWAACSKVFDGIQPFKMHKPPSFGAPSIIATFRPREHARRAALKPALPPPITIKSYVRI